MTRRMLIGAAASLIPSALLSAQRGSTNTRPPVFQRDLPDVELKGWSVTAVEVSYGPGESSPAHRHPGITIAYVLEGEIRSKVGDEPERTYKTGEMFLETSGQLHGVSGNASTTRPARLLAVLMAPKGTPLTAPA